MLAVSQTNFLCIGTVAPFQHRHHPALGQPVCYQHHRGCAKTRDLHVAAQCHVAGADTFISTPGSVWVLVGRVCMGCLQLCPFTHKQVTGDVDMDAALSERPELQGMCTEAYRTAEYEKVEKWGLPPLFKVIPLYVST